MNLLHHVWELAADGRPTDVQGDKHGGRHYYLEPLLAAFPETWIDRGVEGPELSRYQIRDRTRSLSLSLMPLRRWQEWIGCPGVDCQQDCPRGLDGCLQCLLDRRVQGLKPTAGYPVDAARFRLAIEPVALAGGLDPDLWWRRK